MGYTKQNFIKGQILKADHLNAIETGIEANDLAVAALSEENAQLSSKLNSITVPKGELIAVSFAEELSYVLDKNTGMPVMIGTAEAPQNGYRISSHIAVTPGEIVALTASASYNGCLYAFYNTAGGCVHLVRDTVGGGTGTRIVDEHVTVPDEAATMRIAYLYNSDGRGAVKRFAENGVELRKWHGKKWCVIGDSLTEHNIRAAKNYHDYVAEATGIMVVNLGKSGAGYANVADASRVFFNKVANVPVDSDVVTIFGSGNDMSSGLELGTPTDTGTETLCGCINTTIENLVAIMPAVQLGIVSPTPWDEYPPSNTDNPMALYVAAMKTICENRSIPFLDLYHCSNLRPWTEEGRAACYTKDEGNGVHPDETGHALIAPRFKAFLESLIM